MKLHELNNLTDNFPSTEKFPAIFVGHGSPMNAIEENDFTRNLKLIGKNLPKPKAILVISAHWQTIGTFIASTKNPQTIHDFGGFPEELYRIKYPAVGSPQFANFVKETITKTETKLDTSMGLDHGAWTMLIHLFPNADVPVFELSLDCAISPQEHFELAQELTHLRRKGVLILGSGNIVHNLRLLRWGNENATPFDWALEFDEKVKSNLLDGSFYELIAYEKLGTAAMYSVPTNEHYLPMLYTLATKEKDEELKFLYEGFQYASTSMRCFRIG
ncbi:MAG: 4,5-DOPA dioxygenase extradiol [Ignavibacteriales bacterium]|nr:4,5-DOPA dioxygenase extradiol [Ignavibacteriales bacterium]